MFCAMVQFPGRPRRTRRAGGPDARSESVRPRFHSPTAIAVTLSARMDIAMRSGLPDPGRQFPRLFNECPAERSAVRRRSSGRRFERHPAREAVRFAGLERHQQMAHAEIQRVDDIHERQSGRRRPAGIDAQQDIGVERVSQSLDEVQPAPLRAARAATGATTAPTASFGPTAGRLLRGPCGSDPNLDRCARRSGTARPRAAGDRPAQPGRRPAPRRCMPRPPRPAGRALASACASPMLPRVGGRRGRRQPQRVPIEGRRPIEGEGRAGFLGGMPRLNRRMLGLSRSLIVFEQRLAVFTAPVHERPDDEAVNPAQRVGSHVRGQDLANPIVVGLDPLRRAAAADQVGRIGASRRAIGARGQCRTPRR